MPKTDIFMQQGKLLVIYISLLCVLMGGIGALLISNHKRILDHEEMRQSNLELTLISEFIQDSLIRHDYAEIREFLSNWGKTRASVKKLRASFSNGFELLNYSAKDASSRMGVTVTQEIAFGDKIFKLEITRDASYVDNIINQFKNELLLEAFLIVLVIGTSLWYILKKYSITPMEKELLRRTDALVASEQLYRSVAANIPNGAVLIFNSKMKCLFAEGQGLDEIANFQEDMLGAELEDIFAGKAFYKVETLIREALKGNQVDDDDIVSKNKNLWIHAIPLPTESGRFERVLILTQDITESKNMLKDLEKSRVIAESANKAKSEFLANMSHEIRTPMNAIMGYSELLKTERDAKYTQDYLKGITSAGKNLLSTINDILDLSKIESGKLVMSYEPVSISDVAEDTFSIFKAAADAKGLSLNLDFQDGLPDYLFLDETRIHQILVNLVGNAIKFTNEGYVGLKVEHSYAGAEYINLKLTVYDTGIGIDEHQISAIFESFTQQDGQDTRKFGGTGLGLTITKRLTEMMGGKISVTSKVNEGSIFSLVFNNLKIAKYEKNDKHKLSLPDLDFAPATILVVDDVESNRLIIRNFLRNYSLTVIEAENGIEGLELVTKIKPDLILMDIQMPLMDGYEATKKIRAMDNMKNIPIIAVTASVYGDSERVKEIMDGYISKPFSKSELVLELIKFLKYKEIAGTAEVTTEAESYDIDGLTDADKLLIRETFIGRHKEVVALMITQEVVDYAKSLRTFGLEREINILVRFAEDLKDMADSFKVDEQEKALTDFGKTVMQI